MGRSADLHIRYGCLNLYVKKHTRMMKIFTDAFGNHVGKLWERRAGARVDDDADRYGGVARARVRGQRVTVRS